MTNPNGRPELPLQPGAPCRFRGERATVVAYSPTAAGFEYRVRINSRPRTAPWLTVMRDDIEAGNQLMSRRDR